MSTLAFYNEAAQNNCHSRIIKGCMFRDRLGWRLNRGDAKIIPLQIFNLLVQQPPVRLSVNQWVPGSSPGRGATSFFEINRLRRFRPEHRRLLVFWSLEFGDFDANRRAHDPSVGGSPSGHFASPPGPLCPRVHHPFRYFSITGVDFRRGTRGPLVHWSTARYLNRGSGAVFKYFLLAKISSLTKLFSGLRCGILRQTFSDVNHPIPEPTVCKGSNAVPITV